MYDPAIGRFTGVDPISDKFPHVSTYNYAENEPIANIDLHGLQKFSVIDKVKEFIGLDNRTLRNGPDNQDHANSISHHRRQIIDTQDKVVQTAADGGKTAGETIKSAGDVIEKVGLATAVVAPPVGLEIAAVGGTMQLTGDGLIVASELIGNGEVSDNTQVTVLTDALFAVLLKPIENIIENANLDEGTKALKNAEKFGEKFVKTEDVLNTQISIVNELSKVVVQEEIKKTQN